jgi:hypothetical protein
MADVFKCAHCGSTDLMSRMVDFQCLQCGNRTDMSGVALPKEPQFAGGPTAFERRPQ